MFTFVALPADYKYASYSERRRLFAQNEGYVSSPKTGETVKLSFRRLIPVGLKKFKQRGFDDFYMFFFWEADERGFELYKGWWDLLYEGPCGYEYTYVYRYTDLRKKKYYVKGCYGLNEEVLCSA